MRIYYTVLDPTGNITALVQTPVPRELQPAAARAIMEKDAECEQVGFIEKCAGSERLQMMGGEFCGNAAMSFATLTADRLGLDNLETGVEISGAAEPVPVVVKAEKDFYTGTVSMPLPLEIKALTVDGFSAPAVIFPGIAHAVITGPMDRDRAEKLIRGFADAAKAEAFGMMLLSPDESAVTPLVYVRSTDSAVWESSCASGTAAVGAWASFRSGEDARLTLIEPEGSLKIEAHTDSGKLKGLYLTGEVRIVGGKFIDLT